MKAKILWWTITLLLISGCSLFGREKTGYEDSDSVGDLSVPPELNLPQRDKNYEIPEVEQVEVEPVEAPVLEAVEAQVEEAVESTVDAATDGS